MTCCSNNKIRNSNKKKIREKLCLSQKIDFIQWEGMGVYLCLHKFSIIISDSESELQSF